MQILLFGGTGQVGWELQRTLAPLGNVCSLTKNDLNLADTPGIRDIIRQHTPDVIINAAAYTEVDKAESENERAFAINTQAPGIIAEEAGKHKSVLIHYSTDYIFDGASAKPYTEDDTPNPINYYGISKLRGEQEIQKTNGAYLILRTSWVYSLRRNSFVTKILRWARSNRELKIVIDQTGSPTWCRQLAEVTAQILVMGRNDIYNWFQDKTGIYHIGGTGEATRYDFAKAILKYDPQKDEQLCKTIQPAYSEEFPTVAQRPEFSVLNCSHFLSTFGISLPPWKDALRLALKP